MRVGSRGVAPKQRKLEFAVTTGESVDFANEKNNNSKIAERHSLVLSLSVTLPEIVS